MAEHSRQSPALKAQIQSYFIHHIRVFLGSLGRLYQFPGPSAMTVAVIAIALSLPAGLYVLLQNAQQLSGGWDGAARLSLYLKTSVSNQQAEELAQKLSLYPQIDTLQYISRDESLQTFRERSGFGDALDTLSENPLPAVIVITPYLDQAHALSVLQTELHALPEIDIAQLDLQWVKRLIGIMNIIQRGLLVVASMLGIAVILVIGNTIRLDIQNRSREIRVQKMIGATNVFIRRPFLYTGFWYGLLGGLLSWILVSTGLTLLSDPTQRLAGLYQSDFELSHLSLLAGLSVVTISILLGLLGSWVAVSRHLKDIEPGQ